MARTSGHLGHLGGGRYAPGGGRAHGATERDPGPGGLAERVTCAGPWTGTESCPGTGQEPLSKSRMQEEEAKWSEEEEVPPPPRKQATLAGRRQKPNTQPPPRAGARPGPGPRGCLGPHPEAQDALRGGPPRGGAGSKRETTECKDGGPRARSAGRGSATGQVRTSGRVPGPTRTYVGQNCSADRREGAGGWLGGDRHGRRGARGC